MKYIIVAFLVILLGCDKREDTTNIGNLKIIPRFCKYPDISSFHFSNRTVKLFKKTKSTEIKIPENNWSPSNHSAIVNNLEHGEYYLEYISIFNQKIVIQINLNQSHQEVQICADYIDYKDNKNILLIDDLDNGENIIVDYTSMGCFHTSEKPDIITLAKNNNKLSLTFEGKTIDMSESQISLFREFEIELRCNHGYGCTTVDSYGISRTGKRSESHVFTDGSCQWRGFHHLLDTLNLK